MMVGETGLKLAIATRNTFAIGLEIRLAGIPDGKHG